MRRAHWSDWAKLWPLLLRLLLLLLTLGEYWLFRRLLFANHPQIGFILANVTGILAGTPVWKSSQHRVLAPLAVSALERVAGTPVEALAWFMGLGLLAENVLLWRVLRGRGLSSAVALSGVAGFGLARLLALYRLEYPWDPIDVLLFTSFGYWAAGERKLGWLVPLLLLGIVNHETVLYIPLWCALARCDRALSPARRKYEELAAGVGFTLASASIYLLREALYVGPAALPGHVSETLTPWLGNPLHLRHNLRQFLWLSWRAGQALISASLLMAGLACAGLIRAARYTRAAFWSLAVLASVFVFGYVNETRLYLSLIAFWFGYLGAGPRAQARSLSTA